MIVYTVHEPAHPSPAIEDRAGDIVFVKEGFTLFGFLLPPVWLLLNRLWLEFIAAIVLVAAASAVLVQFGAGPAQSGLANFALMLLIGFEGNNLVRWRLERKGYAFLAAVAGRNFEECERRFFEVWTPRMVQARDGDSQKRGTLLTSAGEPWRGPAAIGSLS